MERPAPRAVGPDARAWPAEEPITREANRTPLLTVSALLPGLPIASVRHLMNGLEATVGNGFYDIPRTLDWPELQAMRRGGITIGSHTKNHVSLPAESADIVADELAGSRQVLDARLGSRSRISRIRRPVQYRCRDAVARAGYQFGYTACQHGDASYRALTIERLLLWKDPRSTGDGEFSPAILNCQAQDLWPPARNATARTTNTGQVPQLAAPKAEAGMDSTSRPGAPPCHRPEHRPCASFAIGIVLARLFERQCRHVQAVLPGLRDALRRAAARHGGKPITSSRGNRSTPAPTSPTRWRC